MKKREWLIKAREKKGLSQEEVSKLADITTQHYWFIEKGERRPSPQLAQKLAKILNIKWTMFF